LQPVLHAPETLWLADEGRADWRLTEEELGEMGLPPLFGLARPAVRTGRWLLTTRGRETAGPAAGSGLVGMRRRRRGPVLCADIDPSCAAAVAFNAAANGVTLEFTGRPAGCSAAGRESSYAGDVHEQPMARGSRLADWPWVEGVLVGIPRAPIS
jgi:predicted nicotinamide N-methyase